MALGPPLTLAVTQSPGSLRKYLRAPPAPTWPLWTPGNDPQRDRKQRLKVVGGRFSPRTARLHWKIPPYRRTGAFTQSIPPAAGQCPSVPRKGAHGLWQRGREHGANRSSGHRTFQAGGGGPSVFLPTGVARSPHPALTVNTRNCLHSASPNVRITDPSRSGIVFPPSHSSITFYRSKILTAHVT